MASLKDFLFGAGPLKAAAGEPPVDNNYKPATVSDAQRNADYAAKRLAKPAATPAPVKAPVKKKPTTAGKIGAQLMGEQ